MIRFIYFGAVFVFLTACGSTTRTIDEEDIGSDVERSSYVIGPGDSLQVFVWGHEDLSTTIVVRPDGKISTPLVEDLSASGMTPTNLARAIETELSNYVRSPTVTVIVREFVGEYSRQIRVVGQATEPQSLNFRSGMTLLDVMIAVGGLGEFASGNKAKVIRREGDTETTIRVRLDDLLNDGDMTENIRMAPGDVLVIPESFF